MRIGQKLKLIDLDGSVSFLNGEEHSGMKYSSAYVPPEMVYVTLDDVFVRSPSFRGDVSRRSSTCLRGTDEQLDTNINRNNNNNNNNNINNNKNYNSSNDISCLRKKYHNSRNNYNRGYIDDHHCSNFLISNFTIEISNNASNNDINNNDNNSNTDDNNNNNNSNNTDGNNDIDNKSNNNNNHNTNNNHDNNNNNNNNDDNGNNHSNDNNKNINHDNNNNNNNNDNNNNDNVNNKDNNSDNNNDNNDNICGAIDDIPDPEPLQHKNFSTLVRNNSILRRKGRQESKKHLRRDSSLRFNSYDNNDEKDGIMINEFDFDLVIAKPSYDFWSLGALLFFMAVNAPLFYRYVRTYVLL